MKLIILISIFLAKLSLSDEKKNPMVIKNKNLDEEIIQNVKTFSGPMGMGLIKSYTQGGKKFCFYSNLEGQKVVELKDISRDCPKNQKK
tara:strand:+ start:223 stop:489 length:267 start_codon:yes stop_codon:yes gene_type:complete